MGQKRTETNISANERQKLWSSNKENTAGHNESLTQVTAVSLTRRHQGEPEGRRPWNDMRSIS